MVGLRMGQAFGVLLLPGFGVGSSSPRFLGTKPPCATQAIMSVSGKSCPYYAQVKVEPA